MNKPLSKDIKIGKWVTAETLLAIQHYASPEIPKQIIDLMTLTSALPVNSNNTDYGIMFDKETLIDIAYSRSRRFRSNFNYNKKSIKSPINLFFNMLSKQYKDRDGLFVSIDDTHYYLNDILEFTKQKIDYPNLFKLHITDELIVDYDEDLSQIRKEAIFFNMVLMQNLFSETVFDHAIVAKIFGLSRNDIKSLCKKYGLKTSTVHRELTKFEVTELGLPSATLSFDSELKVYYVPIGYNLISKNTKTTNISEELKELQQNLKRINVNPKVLKEIKNRIINKDYTNGIKRSQSYDVNIVDEEENELDEISCETMYSNSNKVKNRYYNRNYMTASYLQKQANFIFMYNARMFKTIKRLRAEYFDKKDRMEAAIKYLIGDVISGMVPEVYTHNVRQTSCTLFI